MAENENLKIEYIPVDKLKPYERNARKHADIDVDAIAASIQAFGFRDPIGVWGKNNVIVEGHGRLMAAKKLGMDSVPCVRLDDMTDEQRRGYALAHNKTAELSSWDFDTLDTEVEELGEMFDMSSFGFAETPEFLSLLEEDYGAANNIVKHGVVSLTFENEDDAEEVKSYIKKYTQAQLIIAIMDIVRGNNA